jgi:hypothetical protein
MQSRKSILAVPLLIGAIAAPAVATAMPQGNGGYPFTPSYTTAQARQMDMHASTVHQPASPKQDLRSEAAADASRAPATAASHTVYDGRDLRTEAAVDRTPAPEPPPGLPNFPTNTQPLPRVAHQPVATATGGDGDGIDWPIAIIAMAGALLIGGTVGVAARSRFGHAAG